MSPIQLELLTNCNETFTTKEAYDAVTVTNPRSQGCPRFQSGEELANSVGKINAYYSP